MAGTEFSLPVGIAPTGLTRLMHAAGEHAGAAAAAKHNIPFTLATMGTVSIEETAAAAPLGTRWFQLYLRQDRALSLEMMRRARAAGYDALILTVDTAVTSTRVRDQRNGMTLPPTLGVRTMLDAIRRPGWCLDFLTTPPLEFANFAGETGNVSAQFNTMFDASLSYADLGWVREAWPGTLIVKGVQGPEDAVECFGHGADGVVVSNHGGRQLDRAPVPLHAVAGDPRRRRAGEACHRRLGNHERRRRGGGAGGRRKLHAHRQGLPVRADGRGTVGG